MTKKIISLFVGFCLLAAMGITLILYYGKEPSDFASCEKKGYPIMESFPRKCSTPSGKTFTEDVFTDDAYKTPPSVTVESPSTLEIVYGSSVSVKGEAPGSWFFEAVFPISLVDPSGKTIAMSHVEAEGEWMTEGMVRFSGSLEIPAGFSGPAMVVLKKDNPSGLPEKDEHLNIPIVVSPTKPTENSSIKIYFGKYGTDSSMVACSETFGVTRVIPKTTTVGKAALEELLKGPTAEEKKSGYFTSINEGVAVKSLSIENGTAYADFDASLERSVGGSCRVLAIRAQITDTLKQFPSVKNVIISIDGRTEDILQP